MRLLVRLLVSALVLSSGIFISLSARAAGYLVKYKPGAEKTLSAFSQFRGFSLHEPARLIKIDVQTKEDQKLLNEFRKHPSVEYIAQDLQVKIEPSETTASQTLASPIILQHQWALEKVGLPRAWAKAGNRGSRGVTVAVIDSGVDPSHPALQPNLVAGKDFFTGKPGMEDKFGHGTHCAGVIGATGDIANSVSGASPVVSIMPIRFIGSRGEGSLYEAIKAVDYAIEKKVDIISASWGAQISDANLVEELDEMVGRADAAGILFVAAAGNLTRDNDIIAYMPANAAHSNVIAVAASDANDQKIAMSNFGSKKVAIAAPGENIVSTFAGGAYKSMTGTSMATPLIAGIAALIKAQRPSISPAEIRALLQKTGAKMNMANACGCRVDAAAAMNAL